MNTKVSQIISLLFQPLLIPTYGFIVLFNLNAFFSLVIPVNAKWLILLIVFVTTFLLPTLFILILYNKGVVKSLYLKTREDRIIPFIGTIVFYYLSYYLIKRLQISPIYYYFIIGTTFTVVVSLIINFFWKISIHMMAIGGMLGAFIGLSLVLYINLPILIIAIILVAGLVGYARLQLDEHTPAQVYSGFIVGVFLMLMLFVFI